MLYASRGLFNSYLDAEKLEDKYTIWLAQYTSDLSATGYEGEYYMWQYSSNVRIPGIRCRFDGNYLYEKDYSVQNAPKEVTAAKGETATYKLSGGVQSVVPANSNKKAVTAQVTDSYGDVHNYKVWKADGSHYTSDECIMACLLQGLGFENDKGTGITPANVRDTIGKGKNTKLGSLDAYRKALEKKGVVCDQRNDDESVYVDIKGNLASGMPVIISIDADSGPWKGKSQRLLLIGMDEDGRAVVADVVDRKWFETDQRIKLTDIDELISFIDDGYIIIRAVE